MSDLWQEYFEKTKDRPVRPLLEKALSLVPERGEALDLGAGALRDTVFLLQQGFKHVTAVDQESVTPEILSNMPRERFVYIISTFQAFQFPIAQYDLVNAQYTLPFCPPEVLTGIIANIFHALTHGGIFVGQLFGDRDEWKSVPGMTFHTRETAEQLLSHFEAVEFIEDEQDASTAGGRMKHWHVFHFIVRKK